MCNRFYGTKKARPDLMNELAFGTFDVIITTYEMV